MTERPVGQTHINKSANEDGSRNVSFYSPDKGWSPAGRLMAPITNHVAEQPKSLAYKLTEARTRVDFVVDSEGNARDVR